MRVMMDKENIGAILQEMSNERNIQTDSQRKVADFFVDLVVRLEKGDKEAIKMLNMTPQELQQMASQNTMQTEAFENLRSKASGLFGGDPVKKRYDLLIQSLNKHIWEFTQDVKNKKIEDVVEYNQMFAELQKIEPTLQAKGGFFQKIGYGVGRGVGTVAKIGSVGVLGAALGGLGLPAYAIGGILGGGLSVLKNSQSTKMDTKTKLKQALIGAGLGAMVGYAFSKLQSVMGGNESGVSGDGGASVAQQVTPDNITKGVESYLRDNNIPFDNVKYDGNFINVYSNGELTNSIDYNQLRQNIISTDTLGSTNKLSSYINNFIKNK